MDTITPDKLVKMIDHTLLAAQATSQDIKTLCDQAVKYNFGCVCLNPRWVKFALERLAGTGIKICSVAGFPLGANNTETKAAEAKSLIMAGADEVDMTADIAAIIENDEQYLRRDIGAVLKVCRSTRPPVCLKVIIESAALNDEQIIRICRIASDLGVDFVKSSTGFHPAGGAKVEHIRLMVQHAGRCGVKASGAIRTAEQALAMIEAGATRLGTSSSVGIIEQFKTMQHRQ